jgi:hypothetical protein
MTAGRTMEHGDTATHRRPNGSAVETDDLLRDLDRFAAETVTYLRSQVHRTPYAALGAAALAGFVLGRGVSPRLLGVLLSFAARGAVGELVANALSAR